MSVAKRALHGWLLAPALACSLVAGCSDDDEGAAPIGLADGSVIPDSGRHDGGVTPSLDSGLDGAAPAPGDAGPGITDQKIFSAISATGHDRFFAVAYDAAGNIYAAGQTSESTAAGTDYSFVLAKYSAAGVLDPAFGSGGFAFKNVAPGGGSVETARGVVVQASGKIVIAGNAEHRVFAGDAGAGPIANDADVFLVRFNANGQIDASFGIEGVVRVNLGDGVVTQPATLADGGVPAPTLSGADAVWSLEQTPEGKLVIHSATRGLGANGIDGGLRTDTDFALARFSVDGVLDTTFGSASATPGIVRTDFGNTNASVRSATILSTGAIVGVGYSSNTVLTGSSTSAQNPILYKVNADGTPDATFGILDPVTAPGVWHDFARRDSKGAEAYGAALQGSKFVTLGYGPTPNTSGVGSDLVWLRFNADGSQDRTFGTDGVTFMDHAGFSENGRAITLLPDNRVIGVGRGTPAPTPVPANPNDAPADALIAVVTENGEPDTTFAPHGIRLYDFGGPADHLWAVKVSPNKKQVAAVGIQTGTGATANDNAALVILNLP